MKFRFLIACPTLSGGGAERVVSILSGALAELGHDVALLLERRAENEYPINSKVKIYTFDASYSRSQGSVLSRIRMRNKIYTSIIKEYMPDFVMPFLVGMVREMYFACKPFKNVKFIATLRNNPNKDTKNIYRIIQNYVFSHSDYLFLQTDSQKLYVPRHSHAKVFIVPNPICSNILNVRLPYNDSIHRFITCGRLNAQKNHSLMIDSFVRVHEKYPEIYLDIFGEGELFEQLNRLIFEKNASSYIKLKGRTNNISETLSQYDSFLFSSDYEGMPNALMEAMGAGLVCISTDCPTGPKELIGDNERGFLYSVGNVNELTQGIEYVINNNDISRNKAEKARKFINEKFSEVSIAKKLVEKLEELGECDE